MQLSRFLKIFPCPGRPGYVVLYSTATAALALVPDDLYRRLMDGCAAPDDEKRLSGLGMMVSSREEEGRNALVRLDNINKNNTLLHLIAVLNLDCNFACPYCFEVTLKDKSYMSRETADHLLSFIDKRLTGNKKSLCVDFYGGEPLLSIDSITYIASRAKEAAEKKGAAWSFSLVTNGSLFTRKTAQALVPLGLARAQITVDGPPAVHNKSRPFKTGAPSFDTIIKNIRETCDLVKINITGSFEEHTWRQFPLLLDHLIQEGITPDKIAGVKFAPVVRRPRDVRVPAEFNSGCMSINDPWVIEAGMQLRQEILKRGFPSHKLMPMPCSVDMDGEYTVNYDGMLYKCPCFIGRKEFCVGDVQTGMGQYRSVYACDRWKNKECLECGYLPLCYGGCKYMSLVQTGTLESLDCKKPFFDAALETLIQQDITHKKGAA